MDDRRRVGVDGMNLAIPRGTGVATYARGLTHCLAQLGHSVDVLYGMNIPSTSDPIGREVDFFDQLQTERPGKVPKYPSVPWMRRMLGAARGADAVPIPISGRVIAGPLAERLPKFERILNIQDLFPIAAQYFRNFNRFLEVRIPAMDGVAPPEVMHWTYPVPVRLRGARNIYTIHDMVPLRLPYTTLDHKPTHRRLLAACLRLGDHICTVSEASRRDILDFFPSLDPERVTNTYQAVLPPPPAPEGEVDRILRGAFGLEPRGYFLFFGSIEPKKNVGRLLQAYLSSDIALPLVLVGARAWKSEAELALLKDRPASDRRVRSIEYVPGDALATLIRGARAVTFPSLYEGFGLPMLEAMMLGTPVLTSREGSLAEVGGDAALYVDAYDPRDIAAGLLRLATDDALCRDLAARGLVRATAFDMAHYRERVAAMYAKLPL